MRITFTDRELDVMAVLWSRGSATVAEVRERLPDDLAYTTVLSVLRTLEEKGHVGHRGEGKAHRYFPLVERRVADPRLHSTAMTSSSRSVKVMRMGTIY